MRINRLVQPNSGVITICNKPTLLGGTTNRCIRTASKPNDGRIVRTCSRKFLTKNGAPRTPYNCRICYPEVAMKLIKSESVYIKQKGYIKLINLFYEHVDNSNETNSIIVNKSLGMNSKPKHTRREFQIIKK